jgi:hypothetical protein
VVLPIHPPLEWVVTYPVPATSVSLRTDCLALDIEQVAAAIRPKTRMILLNFPDSPTGVVLDTENQTALVEWRLARGICLLNDEVYWQTIGDPGRRPPQIADVYERSVSVNELSKGFGLPGLRVGWIACGDENCIARVSVAKAALSSYLAAPSEVLTQIALRESQRLTKRAREIGLSNRERFDLLLHEHGHVFEADILRNLAFGVSGYRGKEGAEIFTTQLVTKTGALVLPGSLWRSPVGSRAVRSSPHQPWTGQRARRLGDNGRLSGHESGGLKCRAPRGRDIHLTHQAARRAGQKRRWERPSWSVYHLPGGWRDGAARSIPDDPAHHRMAPSDAAIPMLTPLAMPGLPGCWEGTCVGLSGYQSGEVALTRRGPLQRNRNRSAVS